MVALEVADGIVLTTNDTNYTNYTNYFFFLSPDETI